MRMKEKFNLEFKKEISEAFLKTVSAYSNYNDGQIIFGIDDNKELVGINNVEDECLRIEKMINDSINPVPNYKIQVGKLRKKIIILNIMKGRDTPYYYKGKAYKRPHLFTLEVDRFELRRLAIEGINKDYEERMASSQNLHFEKLESKLREKEGIKNINLDILANLNLYNNDGYYNIAAELLADKNYMEFAGTDIIIYGKDNSQILNRETVSKKSLLSQYDRAIEVFEQYYQYEEINGNKRVKRGLIPKKAFRESLANAIVHRVWDTNSYLQIYMYENRIEINSPGGIPEGISNEENFYGNISLLRNPIIAGAFYRLGIIKKFKSAIMRIKKEYEGSLTKPGFEISRDSICIMLPIFEINKADLSEEELLILKILKDGIELPRHEIEKKTGYSRMKTIRRLNSLIEKNIIEKLGKGPGITYRQKKS